LSGQEGGQLPRLDPAAEARHIAEAGLRSLGPVRYLDARDQAVPGVDA